MITTIDYEALLPDSIDQYEFDERAGICEFDAKLTRYEAEKAAYFELKTKYNFNNYQGK